MLEVSRKNQWETAVYTGFYSRTGFESYIRHEYKKAFWPDNQILKLLYCPQISFPKNQTYFSPFQDSANLFHRKKHCTTYNETCQIRMKQYGAFKSLYYKNATYTLCVRRAGIISQTVFVFKYRTTSI